MSDGFSGGGGFGGGSSRDVVDGYYTFKQTSGGGGASGGGGCGTVIVIILVILLIAADITTALITLAVIVSLGLIVFGILKLCFTVREQQTKLPSTTLTVKTTKDEIAPIEQPEELSSSKNGVLESRKTYTYFEQIKQKVERERRLRPEWEGGRYIDFVFVAGTAHMTDYKTADTNTEVGDLLALKECSYNNGYVLVTTQSGISLGYISLSDSIGLLSLIKTGKELFARLHSKHHIGTNLRIIIEVFMKNDDSQHFIR